MSFRGFWGGRARAESGSVTAEPLVQRLFSTFPCGLPGAGLVLLRAAVSIPLVHAGLLTTSSPAPVIVEVVTAGAAVLLLIGLWTPFAGGLIAMAELGLALSHPADPWTFVHLGVLGAALALLGPGGCSVDARLFGRKHIEIPQR
jgi:putative oxidoreductase